MSTRLSPLQRYDMPVVFGPSIVPDKTRIPDASACVLSFRTSIEAARSLVPDYFTVPEEPVVTVAHMAYRDVDYLGGRGYNEIVVSLSARYDDGVEAVDAAFALVLWVDQIGALIAGREYMGLPKLAAVIPDLEMEGARARFSCREYESLLLEAAVEQLDSLPADKLAKVNARAGEVRTLAWKYIPSPGGGADLDYPILNVMRWNYKRAWSGSGALRFHAPSSQDAPLSSPAMRVLAELPRLGAARVFLGTGEAIIDRTATRRLNGPQAEAAPWT